MGLDALGELEHLVLLSIARLEDDAYGVPMLDELRRVTGKKISRASLYVALRRLEAKGLVGSSLGEPSPVRGGRARRYFKLRAAGIRALRLRQRVLLELWDGLSVLE